MSFKIIQVKWITAKWILLLIITKLAAAHTLLHPMILKPADVRYAEARCLNDSTLTANELKAMWSKQIYPDNHETHCYIKCFLNKMGLIDLTSRGLNMAKILQVWRYINTPSIEENCTELDMIFEPLDGTCHSYYKKWFNLTESCEKFINFIIFKVNLPIHSKSLGETATHFCASVPLGDDLGVKVPRDSYTLKTYSYKCSLECVFRNFHYIDAYGRLDESEIQRSFREAGVLTPANIVATQKCTHNANSYYYFGLCKMAEQLEKCLQLKTKDYLDVYKMRDKIASYY